MKMTGADIVVRALEDEGVPFTFGIPGTHNIELYDSLARSTEVRPILVTDEQSASFIADGVYRSSGKLAVANVVPGAGLTHALSGIAEAYLDNVAMLVLACGIRRDTGKAFQLHAVDQMAIARPVTKAQFLVERGTDLYSTIRRACRIARTAPAGPVFVEVPAEHYIFRHVVDLDAWRDEAAAPPTFRAADLEQTRALLAACRRPLLYLGLGAAGADLVALAERLEAPVATTFEGKGIFPESHPLWLWCGFGAAAPSFVQKIAASCDLTLAIGCRFSEVGTGSYGLKIPGKLVHVDIDPTVLNKNYKADLAVVADAAPFIAALLTNKPQRPEDGKLREAIRAGHAKVWSDWSPSADERKVSPSELMKAVQKVAGPSAIYTTDSGNGTFLAIECLRLDRPHSFLAPIDYSCMGYAVPAALGAALACPGRPVIALAGDGAFLMTGLELLTAAQLELPVMVLLLRDRELAQIAQFQQTALGRKSCSELPDYDLPAFCRAVGAEYLMLRVNDEIDSVLRQAQALLETKQPVVVEVAIDYSRKTYFTEGVVRVNFARLPWPDRLRMVIRAMTRAIQQRRSPANAEPENSRIAQ